MASWGVFTPLPQPTTIARKRAPTQPAATQAVLITSTPAGAIVQLGARLVGKTPMTLRVTVGTYKITISRAGYTTVTRMISVKQGKGVSLGVTLTPANAPVAPSTQSPTSQPPREPTDGTEQRTIDRQPKIEEP
jgi:hypothetical protein